MKIPKAKDFKPFAPSGQNGYEESKNFYQDLGFKMISTEPEVSIFDTTFGYHFILPLNKNKQIGENLMLHLWVENVDDWYEYLKSGSTGNLVEV